MTQDDAAEFRQVLAGTYDIYGKAISSMGLALWFRSLERYDLPAIKLALSAHVKNPDTGQFLPKPADVVRAIEGGSDDAALRAWAKLDRALREVGPYRTVVFDDAIIHHCVDSLGGWIKLGTLTEDDWKFQRQPFTVLYRSARTRGTQYPAKLIGIAEAENGELYPAEPVLIGDVHKAQAVLEAGATSQHLTVTTIAALARLAAPESLQ